MKKPILVLVLTLLISPLMALKQENQIKIQKDSSELKEPSPNFLLWTIENQNEYETVEHNNNYLQGWEDGYCEGWKDVKGMYAICPIPPIAPLPLIGRDDYVDGYNRGFKHGYIAAEQDEGW